MHKLRSLVFVLCLVLAIGAAFAWAVPPVAVSAADAGAGAAPDALTMTTQYPAVKGYTYSAFTFNVDLIYTGSAPRVFNVSAKGPDTFQMSIQASSSTQISSIRIDPAQGYPPSVTLVASASSTNPPPPGVYIFTLSAVSDQVKADIQLSGEVLASYSLSAQNPSGLATSWEAGAGQDGHYALQVSNTSSVPLKSVAFSATKPSGWTVRFVPDKIDSLAVNGRRDIDVIITPAAGAAPGDYLVSLNVQDDTGQARSSQDVRTTVTASNIMGWVYVGIAVLAVVALVYFFMRGGKKPATKS